MNAGDSGICDQAGYRLTLIPASQAVLALRAAQIALNTLWTLVSLRAHHIFAGMVILKLHWVVAAAMVVMALQLNVITGLILFPYLVWLYIAAALNLSILRNNRWCSIPMGYLKPAYVEKLNDKKRADRHLPRLQRRRS
ncbi:tryptophan-rich sensory protein [Pseudomonas sp. ANT_J12]|nr:tryptophan-rich sensory protein [Pseudomonas sp. ANT_J12]